ncbi:hypothetical protein [Micromonospora sp. LOL_023]|uniref:hypothetical protein n=1 Tax=Micromonospora sp. LOL_023 TaxID=3345418 RepID=UPI003A887DE1
MVEDIFGGRRTGDPQPVDVTPQPDQPERPDELDQPGRSTRSRRIVIGSVLAAGLLGVGLLGSTGLRMLQQKDASLTTPDEAAGLVRDDSERARDTAQYLRNAFAAGIDLDRSAAAVYRDTEAPDRSVLVFGGTTMLWSPERDLDTLLELVGDEQGAVAGLRTVPAGSLGGVMKCGSAPTDGQDMTACGWADHGSIAVALFPGRSIDESAELLVELRAELQQRG